MGNKLKNIFSNKEISLGGRINFKDQESYKHFIMALEKAHKEGKSVQIKGVNSIETLAYNGKSEYSLAEYGNIFNLEVEPSKRDILFELDTDYGKKQLVFNGYRIDKGIVLQTTEKAIVFLKLFFEKDIVGKDAIKGEISYHVRPENAKNVKALIESHSTILSFLNKFFRKDIGESDGGIVIKNIREYFRKAIERYKKLEFVEKEFGINFDPPKLLHNEENWIELEELYLTLREKEVIRLNVKINDTEVVGMKINQQEKNIKVGTKIDITFMVNIDYPLWNNKVTLVAASMLSNAIIKEVNETVDGDIKISYGEEDSRPMYISYRGFKTEAEAKEEIENIMIHKDKYTNALTVAGHLNKRVSA